MKKITLLSRLLISVLLLNYIFNHFVSYFFSCSHLPSLPLMWELYLLTIFKHTTKQTNPQLRHQLHFYERGGGVCASKDWSQPFGKATPINSKWQRIGLNLAPISFPSMRREMYVPTKHLTFFTSFLSLPLTLSIYCCLKKSLLLGDMTLLKSCTWFEEENQEKSINFCVYRHMCIFVYTHPHIFLYISVDKETHHTWELITEWLYIYIFV